MDPNTVRLNLCIFIVWVNCLVYMTIYRLSDFHNALGTLIKTLTVADIIFGLCCLTDSSRVLLHQPSNIRTCSLISYGLNMSLAITIVMMTCISWDRFYARTYTTYYQKVMTSCKARLVVWISLLCCAICFAPSLLGVKVDSNPPQSCISYWHDYSVISFFFILLLMMSNLLITTICCFFTLKSVKQGLPNRRHTTYGKFDKRTGKVFLGVTVVFYLMWLPFMVITFILVFTEAWVSLTLINFCFNLGLCTSIVKLGIYLRWLPPFRNGFVDSCSVVACKCYDVFFPER